MSDKNDVFIKLYKEVMKEAIDLHRKTHRNEDGTDKETYPFFSSLSQEQKKLYEQVVKRVTVDAVASVLNWIDMSEEIEVFINGEKNDYLCEEFLTAESNIDPKAHLPPVF